MKRTNKRGYRKNRKSRRVKRVKGGLGGSTITRNTVPLKSVDEIPDFQSLSGLNVADDQIKFKYNIKTDGEEISLTDIQGFVSAGVSKLFLKFQTFDEMIRKFYGIHTPWSAIGIGQHEIGKDMLSVINTINDYKITTPKTIVCTSEKVQIDDKEPLQIPENYQPGFVLNVVNYYRKLLDPEAEPLKPLASTVDTDGKESDASQGSAADATPSSPAQAADASQGSAADASQGSAADATQGSAADTTPGADASTTPAATPGAPAPGASPAPSGGLTPLSPEEITSLTTSQNVVFVDSEGTQKLLSVSTIQKDSAGKYYATETKYPKLEDICKK